MSIESKASRLVSKFNQLTQNDQLVWEQTHPHHTLVRGTDDIVEIEYDCQYKGNNFRLYICKFKSYNIDTDTPYWDQRPILEIINDGGASIWTCPNVRGLWDLLDTVKFQAANVENVLNELLADDEEEGA